ncbi:uncharacterized protein LOC144932801 [Lampetra fluviatilis]
MDLASGGSTDCTLVTTQLRRLRTLHGGHTTTRAPSNSNPHPALHGHRALVPAARGRRPRARLHIAGCSAVAHQLTGSRWTFFHSDHHQQATAIAKVDSASNVRLVRRVNISTGETKAAGRGAIHPTPSRVLCRPSYVFAAAAATRRRVGQEDSKTRAGEGA